MNAIEAYASSTSVFPGEVIKFHVRLETDGIFTINIHRKGRVESLVHSGKGSAGAHSTPSNASEIGCRWPPAYCLEIPYYWSSGVYFAHFRGAGSSTEVLFVVKAAAPGAKCNALLQLSVTTYQAYNPWGGKSLYEDVTVTDPSVGGSQRARRVSFNRPDYLANFQTWEDPFISWLENNAFEVDYCTSIDLHSDPDLLNHYHLLLSVGHDEYWSWDMRDNVEGFIANGGNVAFFSGNVCWWQIRFEDGNRTMVCYKDAQEDLTENPNVDPRRVTINWIDSQVGRRENLMTGVSFENGAGWWSSPKPAVGYRVRLSQHWIFDGTDLRDGDEFGREDAIVGYETDAALFEEIDGALQATGQDDTHRNFLILATADLRNWADHAGNGDDGHLSKQWTGFHGGDNGVVSWA